MEQNIIQIYVDKLAQATHESVLLQAKVKELEEKIQDLEEKEDKPPKEEQNKERKTPKQNK